MEAPGRENRRGSPHLFLQCPTRDTLRLPACCRGLVSEPSSLAPLCLRLSPMSWSGDPITVPHLRVTRPRADPMHPLSRGGRCNRSSDVGANRWSRPLMRYTPESVSNCTGSRLARRLCIHLQSVDGCHSPKLRWWAVRRRKGRFCLPRSVLQTASTQSSLEPPEL